MPGLVHFNDDVEGLFKFDKIEVLDPKDCSLLHEYDDEVDDD